MDALLKAALGIDRLNNFLAKIAAWAVLFAALISAFNAIIRKIFVGRDIWFIDTFYVPRANSLLEVQWYLFAAVVMLGAPIVLRLNEHVRVDIFYGKYKGNKPVWVDIVGMLLFLMPVMFVMLHYCWPWFMEKFTSGEMSRNAGGLIVWPAALMLPLGFVLLILQATSEVIKRLSYLQGKFAMDTHYEKPLQ